MTFHTSFSTQLFLRPREVSALAPSSAALCRMMARQIPRGAVRVAEFGPGTGTITREILRAGIAPADLTLFEINPAFCAMLKEAFPAVHVVNAPAQAIAGHGAGQFDAVVSGLPLLSMSHAVQDAIVTAAFQALGEDGVFIQFTYGPVSPLRTAIARRLGLAHTRSNRVWANLPPATVYVYRRSRLEA